MYASIFAVCMSNFFRYESTVNVLSVVFNRYESTTNVFGVGLTMNASILNVGVEVKLNIAREIKVTVYDMKVTNEFMLTRLQDQELASVSAAASAFGREWMLAPLPGSTHEPPTPGAILPSP